MTERAARAGHATAATAQRHTLFVATYLSNGNNATQAAIKAGYSEKTAYAAGHKLLKNPAIAKAIAAEAERVAEKAGVTVERTLETLAHISNSDLRKFYNDDGSMKPPSQWDDEMAAAVASFEAIPVLLHGGAVDEEQEPQGQGGSLTRKRKGKPTIGYHYKLKFWDKNAGVDKSMKHLGLFEKDNAQSRESLVLRVEAAKPVKR